MNAILPAQEEERLQTLRHYGILDTAPEKAFDDIARLASQICGTPISTLSLLDRERQWFKAIIGYELVQIPRDASFCRYTIQQRGVMEVPDTTLDARFRDNPFVTDAPHVRFYAGASLVAPDGHAVGTLCVIDYFPRTLSEEQREALEYLSRVAVTQMELRKLAAEREAARAAQAHAADILRERTEVLSSVLTTLPHQVFWKDRDLVYLGCNPSFAASAGLAAPEDVVGKTDHDLAWTPEEAETYRQDDRRVIESGLSMIDKEEVNVRGDGTVEVGLTSKLPLHDGAGRITGILGVSQNISERKALEAEREHLLTELESLLAEAEARADCDPLTGLLNHRAFHKRLVAETDRAVRDGLSLAVALMDLDSFKFFNDAYGHPAGDDVLCRVADGLRRHCRPDDTLARFGGDEFALLMPGLEAADADALVRRIIADLDSQGYLPPGHDAPVPLRLCAGLAVFPDQAPGHLETLAAAEGRLRLAKTGGGRDTAALHVRLEMSGRVEGFSMLDALVTAVDNKDRYTRRHSEDVLTYSLQIAEGLGLDERTRRTVAVAALLHDVGKVGVPDRILRKPGRLSEAEMEAMRQHPMMGAVMVGAVPGFEEALDAVRHHHERWDGGGYPFGLRGEETPLLARLMAVADAFSAMTTDRPYRKGMAEAEALALLRDGAGSQWDTQCVQAFLRARSQNGTS